MEGPLAISYYEDEDNIDSSRTISEYATNPRVLFDLKGEQINSLLSSSEEGSRIEDMEKITKQTSFIGKFPASIIPLPSYKSRVNRMVSFQKWEGYVLRVLKDSFWARLIDLTHKGPDAEAEILLEEISPDDFELIRPGAIFYWNIGYLVLYSRQRIRSSVIRFQRLPFWSREEIDAGRKEAERLQRIIEWE